MDGVEATILIATHGHPTFLFRTLLGLSRQTAHEFEIIVCEDGSDPDVANAIARFEERVGWRVGHVTQAHQGFRKCRILNEGIRRSRAEYLIFLDADCIPHRHFVSGHLKARQPGRFLVGRRVELGPNLTATLTDQDIGAGRLDRVLRFALPAALRGDLHHFEAAVCVPWWLGARLQLLPIHLRGCNFSCWKTDMIAINGFNEDFETPGIGEDSDIRRRFELNQLTGLSVKNVAVCFHQYHAKAVRSPVPDWYPGYVESAAIQCAHGLVWSHVSHVPGGRMHQEERATGH